MPLDPTRRDLLKGTVVGVAAASLPWQAAQATVGPAPNGPATSIPLSDVRLLPSPWFEAVQANRTYVLGLSPDRLLHNFRTSAGLKPKGQPYGGWEADTIAGHTLGHYLTALALLHAQTGDQEPVERLTYVINELAEVQAAHGDGYVGGFTRKRLDGAIVDGKELFPELMRGEIRVLPFDLNGCWVPFYNWHKLYDGLFHAHALCGNAKALEIGVGLAGYIDRVFAALSDAQVQQVLDCEHGGINDSLAELHQRTGDARWLRLAERIYHHKVLDPLAAQRDELAGLHANTQIPKIIGLARLHEITGKPNYAVAPRFFWEAVTQRHSYVIGGNSDREYFQKPGASARYLTEETCEGCNTYNMLRLTRQLYGWQPDAKLFDYYERAHLNHVMAQQDPNTGQFTYMMPLMSGVARDFSTAEDSFWCCVGSGMESHAKHGDSIWWQSGETLYLNLYIPSTVNWRAQGLQLRLDTKYPDEGQMAVTVTGVAEPKASKRHTLALRIPGWASGERVRVNGRDAGGKGENGYVRVTRRWREGDVVTLDLPMPLRTEAAEADVRTIAVLRGPAVLAADLGAASDPYDTTQPPPALVGADLLKAFKPVPSARSTFTTSGIVRPKDLTFQPFFRQWRRRSAVYFKRHTDGEWAAAGVAAAAEQQRRAALAARAVDHLVLGDEAAEKAHGLESKISYAVLYRGRRGRDARTGGLLKFRMKVAPGPLVLQATYWGEERRRRFHIVVEGERIAYQALEDLREGEFVDIEYAVPEALTRGKESVEVRFDPEPGYTAGPVFGVSLLKQGG